MLAEGGGNKRHVALANCHVITQWVETCITISFCRPNITQSDKQKLKTKN